MGYKSNPIYRWETGSSTPSWSQFITLCRVSHRDVSRAVHYVIGFQGKPGDARGLLIYLCGSEKISEVARKTGVSRFVVSKWLAGKSEPGLDVFLKILHELQFILIEFIEALVETRKIPSLDPIARQLNAQKNAVYSHPELEAILCALNLDQYRATKKHVTGFISELIGISHEEEVRGLELLKSVGLVSEINQKYVVKTTQIDTQGVFDEAVKIRKYWAKKYLEFLEHQCPPEKATKLGYFLIDLSAEGERKALEAYLEFCFKLRAIAQTDTGPRKTVKLCNAQLIDLLEYGRYIHSKLNSLQQMKGRTPKRSRGSGISI
jgi:transcriptional regulator with XRE-family HTH domain